MRIRINDKSYGPAQLETCMKALARETGHSIVLKARRNGWTANIGCAKEESVAAGPWLALVDAVYHYAGPDATEWIWLEKETRS